MGLTLSKIGRHIKQKVFWERRVTARLHLPVWTPPMLASALSAPCAQVVHTTHQPAHCPLVHQRLQCCNPPLPRVLPVIRKHSISVGRVSRPSAECAEKVLSSSSSFATLVVLHSSSSTVPAAAGGRREGWLVGGVPRRASRESETL